MSVVSLDLVHGDVEGAVGPLAHGLGLVDAELRGGHRLPLRERSQVEAELLPVGPRLQQVPLLLHWRRKRRRRKQFKFKINFLKQFINVYGDVYSKYAMSYIINIHGNWL